MLDLKELIFSNLEKNKYGTFSQGRFFYWGGVLNWGVIFLKNLKRKVDLIINFIAYAVAVSGGLGFIYWLYSHQALASENLFKYLFFWRQQHPLILLFFVALGAVMFLIYRRSEFKAQQIKIHRFKELKIQPGVFKGPKIDVSGGFNDEATKVIEEAYLLADKLNQGEVSPLHLFWALFKDQKIRMLFLRLGVDLKSLLTKTKNHLAEPGVATSSKTSFSVAVQEILVLAYLEAVSHRQIAVTPLNILLYCYHRQEILDEILYDSEVTEEKIINAVEWFRVNAELLENARIYRRMARLKPGSNMNRAYTAVATPTLDHFSRDLTLMAKYGYFEICLARDKQLKNIFETFESGQGGALLVGPVGVGKRTIVEGLAQLMVKEDVPYFLKDKRLVEIDLARLVGGVSAAEAQERMLVVISEVMRARNVILFIDSIESLMGISSGGEGSLELSEVLANALSRQQILCLATITNENYAKYVEGQTLGQVMAKIVVGEPNKNEAIQMLESKIGFFEGRYGIYFDYNAIEQAVVLATRYINDKYLPEKAINILQLAAVKVSKTCQADASQCFCSSNEVANVVSEATGIPVNKISESETQKLLELEEYIHRRMIGQEEAVKAIAGSLRRARAELREGKRPIASFLFLGPTGVGKTELAKSVAEVYFGDENCMVRLDMSEYQLSDSVNKMIGDANGTLGYLTEAVRKKPFTLVLFDEVEKAHPDVLNLFLQLMDDGRLTDGQGRTINFTNTIVVATSNAGALYIEEAVKTGVEMAVIKQELVDVQLNKFMRPELINRFDGIIVFKPLSFANVVAITKLMLNKMAKSLEPKGLNLVASEMGVQRLAQLGYDPKFGARPLRRLLQDQIENEIANLLLAGDLKRRDAVLINDNGQVEIQHGREL